jgi:serine/threonine protein kinase
MRISDLRDRLQGALGATCRIERELGGGGMSHVFVANDEAQQRHVVVKVLSPELAGTVDGDRFRREIHILTTLHHPGIVPILGSGPAAPVVYYTMPMIEGDSLRTVLHRERHLPVEKAVRYATEIANALAYAHEHNIVHRDIKPENILIDGDSAVVLDFGISKAIERSGDIESLTATGFTIGTPTYMSPEQGAAQKHIDGRSDIYSLACVLHEMLVGEPPFPGTNRRLVMARHQHSPPPSARSSRPEIPVNIDQALLKALAKNPADRYDTAGAFAEAIRCDALTAAADRQARDARVEGGNSMKANMKATAFTVLGAVLVTAAVVVARCAR